MERFIVLNGQKVKYTLTFKKVKNLNARIKRQGELCVSASLNTPIDSIEKFLVKNADFILKAIEKYKQKPTFNYNDGDKLFVFGEQKTLKLVLGQNAIKQVEDMVVLSVENLQDLSLKKKGLDAFYKHKTKQALDMLVEKVFLSFKQKYNIVYPTIKITKLTAAWGNCRKQKNEIHFSTYLSKLDMQAIKYVIVHEFAHLLQDNHSAKFYKIVAEFMPEYKLIRKNMKKY